jgi:hypothetical protein
VVSEEEIRALEIAAAKRMGWHTLGVPVEARTAETDGAPEGWAVTTYAYHSDTPNATMYYLLRPGEETYGRGDGCSTDEQNSWKTYCPRFARDPEAKWQSLEFWMKQGGECGFDDDIGKYELWNESLFVYDAGGHLEDGKFVYDADLGLGVCRAIAALPEPAQK